LAVWTGRGQRRQTTSIPTIQLAGLAKPQAKQREATIRKDSIICLSTFTLRIALRVSLRLKETVIFAFLIN
jgi:hypothetical protein